MDVLGLDHVDLTVNDLARSIPFYEEVLGALGFRRVPHATYVVWANAHLAIGLRPGDRAAAFDRYRVGLHHLALRVRSRDEVDRFHDLLVRAGNPRSATAQHGSGGAVGAPMRRRTGRSLPDPCPTAPNRSGDGAPASVHGSLGSRS